MYFIHAYICIENWKNWSKKPKNGCCGEAGCGSGLRARLILFYNLLCYQKFFPHQGT